MAGMIVAEQPDAVEAGANILKAGGNAIDAAIACVFAQGVIDQMNGGIAGYGCAQVYLPAVGHFGSHYFCQAPCTVVPGMWIDRLKGETPDGFGFILKDYVNDYGYKSIAVPGAIKGWFDLHERFGALSWDRVLRPAIDLARSGYRVTPAVREQWFVVDDAGRADNIHRLRQTPEYQHLFFDDRGTALKAGAVVKNPDYANTLEKIASGGSDAFYVGEIADAMCRDMEANGGMLTADDLRNYEVERVEPLWGEYRGHRISVLPAPSSGPMLLHMLHVLDHIDLRVLGHNSPRYIATVAEVMKRAQILKDEIIGDPRFEEVDHARIIDRLEASVIAARVEVGERVKIERIGSMDPTNTTHVCVIDKDGNAVTLTHSLAAQSGVITPGLGFMYNGAIGMYDPRPGNRRSLEPGRRRVSSMTPTMIFAGDKLKMLLGAPGGSHIPMGILQVILNVIDHGMSPCEAVNAPRFSAPGETVDMSARIPAYVADEVRARGYSVSRSAQSFTTAKVHAIVMDDDGRPVGGADPGGGGMALEV